MIITYAELSKYPFNMRERILQQMLVQYAWEVFRESKEKTEPKDGSQ